MTTSADTINSNISWLKPSQVEAMLDAAHSGRHGLRDEALVTVLYDTGLRRAELAALDRDMVDLDERELRIPATIQKDYPNENTPSPATFELDRGGDLRTVRALRAYLNERMLRAEDGNTLYDVRNRLRHATIVTTERKYDHFDRI